MRAWVRRVEQFRGRLGLVLGDEDHAGAGRRVAELCGGWVAQRLDKFLGRFF